MTTEQREDLPQWAADRAAQDLCAIIDNRCVTHDAVADYGHHLVGTSAASRSTGRGSSTPVSGSSSSRSTPTHHKAEVSW